MFYCTCGCSRGKHHDSHKQNNEVGHCHKCGAQNCPKYKRDSDRNIKPTWQFLCLFAKTIGVKFALALILPWCAINALTYVTVEHFGLHEKENEIFFIVAFFVLGVQLLWFVLHYTLANPLGELADRIRRN